ncbi:MAG: ABC transporter ATP-binding protein, partial [Candidatus Heimdallarchaeota archaeon]|nr:ABC transporter ATP-binding protein [Candidatus Heimdallarchaeota archaeon]
MSSIIVDIDKLDRKARLASLKWIVSHLMKNRLSFGIVIFGLISINAITALLPYLIGVMIDEAVIPNDRELVIQFALVILILGVSRVLLGYLMIFNNNILSWNAIKSIRIEFFENVQRKPLKFHNKAKSGDLMAMATNDMNQLGFMINPGMRLVSEAFLTLVFVIILALRTDRTMATFLLPFFLVYLLAIRRYNESMTPIARVFQEKWSKISRTAQDSITGVRVVRAFNAEDHEKAKFRQVVDDFKITWKQRQMLTARYWPQLIIYLTIGSSFLFGIWLVGENRLSVGQLIGINGMLILLIPPTFLISFAINMLQGGLAGGERIFHTMMVEEHEDKSDHEKQLWPENVAGKIEFKHVNFRYEEAENYVLKDINLVIEPGETVALVGPTGCGKTSLTKLLLRFFEYEGEITIDGTD